MGKFDEQLGMLGGIAGGAANTFLGGLAGQIWGKQQDERQIEQQKKLTEIGKNAGMDMAKYNADLQYEMWNKTNYGAQMEHLREAGLNPGLIYGMSGGGGATTGSPGGSVASSGQAANAAQTQQANMAMGMQLAQMKLLEAQTDKTKAETAKVSGVDTEKAKADTDLAITTNSLRKVEDYVSRHTQQEQIEKIIGEARTAIENSTVAKADADVAKATVEDRIEMLRVSIHKTMNEGDNAVRQGALQEAELILKNFEADLAKQGISPNSPWYVKMVTDMLKGLGLAPKEGIKTVKDSIK